ncbi:MAG: hypothetical protein AAFR93_07445 [Pseudomonadota bacterium]
MARFGLLILALISATGAMASSHTVSLVDAQGMRVPIATLTVGEDGEYKITMAAEPFTDHFLSMRPFKCLEGPEKHWCHVPYPYPIKRSVAEDLTDLEYDFLFLWKGATEYGINMWNGVYYKLTARPDGGIEGVLHEMDMDILSAPPEAGNLRPVRDVDLEESDPDSHWLPRLVID